MKNYFSGYLIAMVFVLACQSTKPIQRLVLLPTAVPTPVVEVVIPPKPIALKIGKEEITPEELLDIYKKNIAITDTLDVNRNIKEYAELYANYKLKVLAGKDIGLDTSADFKEELATYRTQLSKKFLTEKNVSDALLKEAYERLKEEVRASHILIQLPENASPQDTLIAYNKIKNIREQALVNADFASLVRLYSQDPTVLKNSGDLGFFTVFQMVYPFETMAYQTPKGKISPIIRTPFGYHIIKVIDRRVAQGRVRVAHVMVRVTTELNEEKAKKQIDDAYLRLKAGEKFEAVVRSFSDDASSKYNGGILPVFGVGQYADSFEEAAFSLGINEYSKPFQSPYGWHIVKLLERKEIGSFNDVSPTLYQKIQADGRSNLAKTTLINRLTKEYNFSEDPTMVQVVVLKADSSLLKGQWAYEATDPLSTKILCVLGNKKIPVLDFFEFVTAKQKNRTEGSPETRMANLYSQFVEQTLLATEDFNLEKKYPEFKETMQEYYEGIILYQMMEKNVWQKSIMDTLGQRLFFGQNREKYRQPERFNIFGVVAADDATMKDAQQIFAQYPYPLRRRLPDMYFEKNRGLSNSAIHKEQLRNLLVVMTRNPNYVVEVSGYTDPLETDSISGFRIKKIVHYLTKKGVDISRIIENDEGKYKPISRVERAKNMRISFRFYTRSKQDVEKKFNQYKTERLAVYEGFFKKEEMPRALNNDEWEIGTKTYEKGGKVYFVDVKTFDPSRFKTFEEAKGSVINDYQIHLEKEWLRKLRIKHSVAINEEEMKKLMNK